MIKRLALWAALSCLVVFGFSERATAQVTLNDTPAVISAGVGWFDLVQADDQAADFRLEYRHGDDFLFLKPWAGLEVTSEGSVWGGIGVLVDVVFYEDFVVTASLAPGFYEEGDGKDLGSLQPHRINHAGLAYVPEYRGIFSDLTVKENLTISEHAGSDWPAARVLELFPALEPLLGRKGGNLSGGEQQMLAIGRALMSSPKFLLLDEPSQGLAPLIVEKVVDTLHHLRGENIGILLVEQNAEMALEIADNASIIEQGEIVFTGTAEAAHSDKKLMDTYLSVG